MEGEADGKGRRAVLRGEEGGERGAIRRFRKEADGMEDALRWRGREWEWTAAQGGRFVGLPY